MHTRYATQGIPEWNDNNHPIITGSVVGVHNGHVSNDDWMFKCVEDYVGNDVRIAHVDSEAIFAALGWTQHTRVDVLEAVRGSAASHS